MTNRCLTVLVLCLVFGHIRTACAAQPDTRIPILPTLRIVVLPFQVITDAATNDWEAGFPSLLRSCLFHIESSEVLGGKRTRSLLADAGATSGPDLDGSVALRIAAASEADVVVWGRVAGVETGHSVTASFVRAGSDSAPTQIEVDALTWAGLAEALTLRLTELLGRRLHEDDHLQWRRSYGLPDAALQPLAHLISMEIQEAPDSDRERLLRATLKSDPDSEWARMDLIAMLEKPGREEEFKAETAELLRRHPESCNAHLYRAWEKLATDKAEATHELQEALRVHRGCPGAASGFCNLLREKEDLAALKEVLGGIHRDRPDALRTRILLAGVRSQMGDREGAFELLQGLERPPEEIEDSLELSLLMASLACDRYDLAGRELTRLGPKSAENSSIRETLASIKATASPDGLSNTNQPIARPRSFTSSELQSELERRLSPAERLLLEDPIEQTPAIVAEARRLTRGLSNSTTQTVALFAEVVRRGRGTGDGGKRTARKVLEATESAPVKLSCQEHAKLFVSLARAVGLEAWVVHVDRDASGQPGLHDCAVVFLDGHGILVDPTWNRIGLRHKEFSMLDDLQAISHQAMQVDEKPDPVQLRAGLKLNPDDRWTQLQFVTGMARAGQLDEATMLLKKAQAVSAECWDVHAAAADLEMARQEWKPAQGELLRALALGPSNALVHTRLVIVYSRLHDSQKATEHLEAALKFDRGEIPVELRRSGLAEVEIRRLQQRAERDEPASVAELVRLAGAGSIVAMYALAQLSNQADPPRVEEGLAWLKKAAELGDAQAEFDFARILLSLKGETAASEAATWFTRAAEQGRGEAQYALGLMLYEGRGVGRDNIAAVKWIVLAQAGNHPEAKYLFKEMDLLLPATDLTEGRKQAAGFKPRQQ